MKRLVNTDIARYWSEARLKSQLINEILRRPRRQPSPRKSLHFILTDMQTGDHKKLFTPLAYLLKSALFIVSAFSNST